MKADIHYKLTLAGRIHLHIRRQAGRQVYKFTSAGRQEGPHRTGRQEVRYTLAGRKLAIQVHVGRLAGRKAGIQVHIGRQAEMQLYMNTSEGRQTQWQVGRQAFCKESRQTCRHR